MNKHLRAVNMADDLNSDWIKAVVDVDTGETARDSELALHAELATTDTQVKHMAGQHDQRRHAPNKQHDNEFVKSPVGKTLEALSEVGDFVVFGSTALRLYAGEGLGRIPNDIDVLDLHMLRNSERFVDVGDPRARHAGVELQDVETGVSVRSWEPNQVMDTVTGMRAPKLEYMEAEYPSVKPVVEQIGKFKVLPLRNVLAQKLSSHRDKDEEDILHVIRALDLPKTYMSNSTHWDNNAFMALWQDAQGQ